LPFVAGQFAADSPKRPDCVLVINRIVLVFQMPCKSIEHYIGLGWHWLLCGVVITELLVCLPFPELPQEGLCKIFWRIPTTVRKRFRSYEWGKALFVISIPKIC